MLVFGLLFLFLIAFVYRVWTFTRFPYTVEYGEGPVIDWARQFAMGHWPYKPIAQFPYTFSVYTPLYLWLSALFLRFGGPAPWGGRLISALGILGSAWALYGLARREHVERKLAAIAALIFLASPFAYRWATFYRPDALALAFSLAGAYVVYPVAGGASRSNRHLATASALFLLASLIKQSFVAAPVAFGIALLVRNRRKGGSWIAAMMIAGGAIFLALNAATAGAFFTDVVTGNANPYDFSTFLRLTRGFLGIVPVIALVALIELGLEVRQRQTRIVGLYLLIALLLTLSAGKAGAWENYYLESLALFCVLGAVAGQRLIGRRRPWGWVSLALLVVLQLALFLPGFERLGPRAEAAWLRRTAGVQRALSARISTVPDPVLAEDMGLLAVNERPVPIHSFVYTQLAAQGVWAPAPFLADLANQRFPLLVVRRGARADREGLGRFSREMLSAIEEHYDCSETIDRFEICSPSRPLQAYNGELAGKIRLRAVGISSGPDGTLLTGGPRPGSELVVTLLWQAEAIPEDDYTVFIHLVDAQGERQGQHDGPPLAGTFPTGRWRPGDVVRDVHRLTVAAGAPPGTYRLLVGLYRSETGERLPVTAGQAEENALIVAVGDVSAGETETK